MFVGMADGVDAPVPLVELQDLMSDWDAQRNAYRLEPLQDFVPEVGRRLKAKSLSKSDVLILICRSGDRSSRGANRLAEEGYTRVYSVTDGFFVLGMEILCPEDVALRIVEMIVAKYSVNYGLVAYVPDALTIRNGEF